MQCRYDTGKSYVQWDSAWFVVMWMIFGKENKRKGWIFKM